MRNYLCGGKAYMTYTDIQIIRQLYLKFKNYKK